MLWEDQTLLSRRICLASSVRWYMRKQVGVQPASIATWLGLGGETATCCELVISMTAANILFLTPCKSRWQASLSNGWAKSLPSGHFSHSSTRSRSMCRKGAYGVAS